MAFGNGPQGHVFDFHQRVKDKKLSCNFSPGQFSWHFPSFPGILGAVALVFSDPSFRGWVGKGSQIVFVVVRTAKAQKMVEGSSNKASDSLFKREVPIKVRT